MIIDNDLECCFKINIKEITKEEEAEFERRTKEMSCCRCRYYKQYYVKVGDTFVKKSGGLCERFYRSVNMPPYMMKGDLCSEWEANDV